MIKEYEDYKREREREEKEGEKIISLEYETTINRCGNSAHIRCPHNLLGRRVHVTIREIE